MANENSNVVVDRAQSHWSDLWKKEDYWAIWLGFALLIAAICIFINGAPASYKETIDKSNAIMKVEAEKAPFKTIAYIQAQDAKKGVVGTNLPIAKEIKAFIASPGKWTDNPVKSMFTSQAEADAKNAANKEKAEAAKAKAESSFAAAQAAEKLAAEGRRVRVVSMPSCEVFDRQDAAYRESVLPSSVRARVAVEAQTAAWWWKYVGLDGRVIGMETFGASAPAGKLFPKFGFTVENIVRQSLELL